jgi:NDP-sugar pyrophosphorylase family protein
MGEIGKQLPKVLWPVFEKSLLELQVNYARSLGIQNIYINLHYMGDQIEAYCKGRSSFQGVQFLWERPEILDIGGAVHNLAVKVKYKGRLLVLNADQFFYMGKEDLLKFLVPYEKYSAVLFTYEVNTSLGYNALEVDETRMIKRIIQNKDMPKDRIVETYTGISCIDLSKLEKIAGKSPFFESVCPFDKTSIPVISLKKMDYWDFGTIKRYWETMHRLLSVYRTRSTHPFLRFLVQERALKTWKIDLQRLSYHAKSTGVLNFNPDEESKILAPTIILEGFCDQQVASPSIWWRGIKADV